MMAQLLGAPLLVIQRFAADIDPKLNNRRRRALGRMDRSAAVGVVRG
jgi:hypothetical protein